MTTVEPPAPIAPPPPRLPNVGTIIFTVMSALAVEKQAVNPGQDFPDFDRDLRIVDAVSDVMRAGLNQYPPMAGMPALRQVTTAKVANLYGYAYDADREIAITAGATQALLATVLCCAHPGDEVIVFEPTYDSYIPSIELAGGKVVPTTLNVPDFCTPFDTLAAAITWRTRLIMLNTSHNPTDTVWHADDMCKLAEILVPTNVLLLSDEVHEHMMYDGVPYASMACIPELAYRAFVVSNFSRMYHVTGWKVDYVAAPAALMTGSRKVHQFNVSIISTPVQYGLANYIVDPRPYLELPASYQRKRDLFRAGLENTRFKLLPCQGMYFQCVDYSAILDLPEAESAKWPTSEIGAAVIPVSASYSQPHRSGVVRFCFAKKDETFQITSERLSKM